MIERRKHRPFRMLHMNVHDFWGRIILHRTPAPPPAPGIEAVPEKAAKAFKPTGRPRWVREIDLQHERLAQTIHRLHQALRQDPGTPQVQETIQFLRRYVDEHFALEEHTMARLNYPKLETHRAEHRRLAARVQELGFRVDSGDASVALDLSLLLFRWFKDHIQQDDEEFVAFDQEALPVVEDHPEFD
jgi:hemerythrin-like metal-binding protein